MIIELVSERSFKVKNLIFLILSIISLSFSLWFYYFKDGSEKFYNEDGTIQIDTYEDGDVLKIGVFREDGTLQEIDMYERGVYLYSKKMKSIN